MRLATWNMQGSNASTDAKWQTGVSNAFRRALLDAMCLQETGGVPSSAMLRGTVNFVDPYGAPTSLDIYNWGATQRPRSGSQKTIVFHEWDTAGGRVNTAVVTRGPLPHPFGHIVNLIWGNAGRIRRPAVGVFFRGEWIYSFHATSPRGGDTPHVLDQVETDSAGVTWRVGGDFNRWPTSLDGLISDEMVICPPNAPTHPNRRPRKMLDYFVCQGDEDDEVEGQVGGTLALSDHRVVYYTF